MIVIVSREVGVRLFLWVPKGYTVYYIVWEFLIYTAAGRRSFHALALTSPPVSRLQSQSIPFKTPHGMATTKG